MVRDLVEASVNLVRAEALKDVRKRAEENAEAIAEYNRRIAERGLIGDKLRKW